MVESNVIERKNTFRINTYSKNYNSGYGNKYVVMLIGKFARGDNVDAIQGERN